MVICLPHSAINWHFVLPKIGSFIFVPEGVKLVLFFFNLGLRLPWPGLICCQSFSLNNVWFTQESVNKFNLTAWGEIPWSNSTTYICANLLEGLTKTLRSSFYWSMTLPTWSLSVLLPVFSVTACVLSTLPGRFLFVFFWKWIEHAGELLKYPICPHEKQITYLLGHFPCSYVRRIHVLQDILYMTCSLILVLSLVLLVLRHDPLLSLTYNLFHFSCTLFHC